MKILAIDTSFDDISISVIDKNKGILFNYIHNENKKYIKYGGVVPNIVSKFYIKNISNIFIKVIKKYNIKLCKINGIACTIGPGLYSSLLVGTTFSKSLSYSLKIPFYPINHLEGHLLSPTINNFKKNIFPFIGLIITGGNTQLILAKNLCNYKIIGKTLDDPIGEMLDKIASLLSLNYPGGPEIYKLSKYGIKNIYNFPRPMLYSKDLNFSFSGLKTHIKNVIKKIKVLNHQIRSNISLELQYSILDIITKKLDNAIKIYKINKILISGGVISNIFLREKLKKIFYKKKIKIYITKKEYCTDNAAMIAHLALIKILNKKFNLNEINNLKIIINNKIDLENNIL